MVRQLRTGSTQNGLILANGGWISYEHAICISKQPRQDKTTYPDSSQSPVLVSDPIPPIDLEAEGKAQIEVN